MEGQVDRPGYVYIMASGRNGTIYVGVTSDLVRRAYQHRTGMIAGFTRQHGCGLLVWYEAYDDIQDAREKERRMKKWNRQWKLTDIERMNPAWKDLYPTLLT
jgi:putative endonuclease